MQRPIAWLVCSPHPFPLVTKAHLLCLFVAGLLAVAGFRSDGDVAAPFPPPRYQAHPTRPGAVRLLGRVLFYDPILSRDSSVSCASCHSPYNAFAHTDHALSHGISDSIGMRNAPALFNLSHQPYFMWDGAIHHLDAQALAPIAHPGEMGENLEHVLSKLRKQTLYRNLFRSAYGDSMASGSGMLKAIGFFLSGLESKGSRYDSVVAHRAEFTEQERSGFSVFSAHCAGCHPPPLFSRFTFERNGLAPDARLRDEGRKRITGNAADAFRFKVPSLRNLEFTAPYMHDGRFRTLNEVVLHYNNLNTADTLLSSELRTPMRLNERQRTDLVAFLLCLNDARFPFQASHQYPRAELDSLRRISSIRSR